MPRTNSTHAITIETRPVPEPPETCDGVAGSLCGVWAPNAEAVSIVGDFNGWDKSAHPLAPRESSGIWESFIPGVKRGSNYKYHIRSRHESYKVDKADPFAKYYEVPP